MIGLSKGHKLFLEKRQKNKFTRQIIGFGEPIPITEKDAVELKKRLEGLRCGLWSPAWLIR